MTESPRPAIQLLLTRIGLLGLLLFAFALRLYRLDAQSIWWDEAISIHLAHCSAAEIVADRAGNLHPPLYFFLLKGWVALAGDAPFSVRFLSACSSLPLIPALYAFGRRWTNRRAGFLAALLAALSPLYLAYAQEARVYALLPLAGLALLAVAWRLAETGAAPTLWRHWLALLAAEALALGLHYMALFVVATIVAGLFIRLRRRSDRLRLLAVQGLVLLALLPWLLVVWQHAGELDARLAMGNWQAEAVTLAHFVRLLWVFQLTGLSGLVADPAAVLSSAAAALAALTAFGCLVYRRATRATALTLLLAWLLPLASAFVVWQARPLAHPRYVILFTPPLFLLLALALERLFARTLAARGLASLLAISLAATSGLGILAYHAPRFAKDDARGAAAAIAARAAAGDLVLTPPEDWSVAYYYDGPAQVAMVPTGDAAAAWAQLAAQSARDRTVFLVDYYRGTRDPRGLLPFALESAGSLVDRWPFKGLYVQVYRMERPVEQPALEPLDARFGPLRLSGAWADPRAAADTAVAVALRWQVAGTLGPLPCRVGLRLRDADGWSWARADDWLLDDAAQPTTRWAVGQETVTYHLLALPPGTPPLTYSITAEVYRLEGQTVQPLDLMDGAGNPQGRSATAAIVRLASPLGLPSDPYRVGDDVPRWEQPLLLGDGLILLGAALDRAVAAPGQPIFVTLHWAGEQNSPPPQATLLIQQGESVLATTSAPVGGRYSTDQWLSGQPVVEHRYLVVPPAAADGPAALLLQAAGQRVELGTIEVAAGERRFDPPPMSHELGIRFGDVAELLGYDLAATTVPAGEPVPLTLYWRALEGAATADYTVFAHLLAADGRLVGQHDGPPAGGGRPTTGWLPGEIIVDPHVLTFREAYTGSARVEVGLYDPASMVRVVVEGGADFVLLPALLTVE
ncbi:MAG: glycosyltransferase family 39 protein [Anaerolineae bacterium]|nr:glycosyltransferase family 39 protein [Anaerolineae bacterium]